jgi:hypothetical protein
MLAMPSRILTIALCLSLVSCKGLVEKYTRSNSGTSALEKKVLYDFRVAPASIRHVVSRDTERQVLSAIPPASCPEAPGQLRPALRILSAVEGAFTYAAEHETAYLISGLPCGWPDRILVFSSGKLQASADTAFSAIAGTYDLNHDDKNELLLATQRSKDGIVDREAALVDFEKNALHPVEDFGTVYHDPCALFVNIDDAKRKELIVGGRSPFLEAVVFYYLPRPGQQMPSFTAERYRASCSTPTKWERLVVR